MNVYDFDHTIYNGDSTINFYLFCLKNDFIIVRNIPKQLFGMILYKIKKIDKTQMKQYFYSFLRDVKDTEQLVDLFWQNEQKKIVEWYMEQRLKDDVIISASPEFLLKPIAEKLGCVLIASKVDIKTGYCYSPNCYGEEKCKRFEDVYGKNMVIQSFYSDSRSDWPMAQLAEHAYLVSYNEISKW